MSTASTPQPETTVTSATDWYTSDKDLAVILVARGRILKGFSGSRNRPDFYFEDGAGELTRMSATCTFDLQVDGRQLFETLRTINRELDETLGRYDRNVGRRNSPTRETK